MQLSNLKGRQQPGRNKKKGNNNIKGGNNNDNVTNDKNNNNNNAGGEKKPKPKVKFHCKLCKDDHLTHLCPCMEDASRFLAQGLAVLTNPLPHNQNMNSRTHDQSGGDQDPPEGSSGHGCRNMVVATWCVLLRL